MNLSRYAKRTVNKSEKWITFKHRHSQVLFCIFFLSLTPLWNVMAGKAISPDPSFLYIFFEVYYCSLTLSRPAWCKWDDRIWGKRLILEMEYYERLCSLYNAVSSHCTLLLLETDHLEKEILALFGERKKVWCPEMGTSKESLSRSFALDCSSVYA